MENPVVYRCLSCLDRTVTREYGVSHLSLTCPACGSFERFVNEGVYEQFRAFEEDPPPGIEWDELDRRRKLVVSEQVARRGKSVEDFEVE